MMMIPMQAVMKFASLGKQCSPSLLCHFNRAYIRNFFLFTFCLTLTRQIFGDVIVCNHQDQKIPVNYLEMECYINGTITKKQDTIINHFYYQWVSVVLLLEAFAFWLPYQVLWFVWFREFNHPEKMTPDRILSEIQRTGRYAFWKTFAMEWIYLFHLILQAILIDMFLDYGLSKGLSMNEIFPSRGSCYLDYFSGGDITIGRFICLLPLNIFYKKIFSVMFVGFWILLGIHVVVLISRIVLILCPRFRKGYFQDDVDRWWFSEIMKQNSCDVWELERVLEEGKNKYDTLGKQSSQSIEVP